jgi:soluble lytic murein transglycosylase-like protein
VRSPIKIILTVTARLACAFALPAHADVLEISTNGHVWIAGGPQAAVFSGVGVAGSAELVLPPSPAAPALTEVSQMAGPAVWRDRVAELSAKYDISASLLEALVWQESRWRVGAVSPVGARGLAQLMPGTARQLGVDASDPSANLEGGARYLRMQLDTFGGDLEKALAAYNAGPARVARAGGIPRIAETQNYVAAILSRLAEPVRR